MSVLSLGSWSRSVSRVVAFDVELVEAVAELAPEPTAGLLPDAFGRKYTGFAERAGMTIEDFAAIYSQPIRIRPTRWLGWGGSGGTSGYAS